MNIKGFILIICILFSGHIQVVFGQKDSDLVDIVWLRDGSRLSGTILRWELESGIEFQLATGATMIIPKKQILKVFQQMPLYSSEAQPEQQSVPHREYAFRERGWYHSCSGFINAFGLGGAGFHYSTGFRFKRTLSAGLGIGYESNDLSNYRDIVPLFAEVRGFLLPKRITPYYALKAGHGFAILNTTYGDIDAKGGIHLAAELGVRFGGRHVHYFAGAEYKIQDASYQSQWWWEGSSTDHISYRRLELRTGILF
jgi:hypothetical protein